MANVNQQKSVKICSINIGGFSNRSKLMTNKYTEDEQIDILFMQESGPKGKDELRLQNMKTFTDTNKSANRGAVLYVRGNITATNITEISKLSKEVDSAWGIAELNTRRYILGSIYVKLNSKHAMTEALKMLNKAEQLKTKLRACGVILAGDFNARHQIWGDKVTNDYGKQLHNQLDNTRFKITKAETPTFLCENGSSHIDFIITSNCIAGQLSGCHTDDITELYSGAPMLFLVLHHC